MKTVIFDVMCEGRFVMQYKHQWCPAFPIDFNEIIEDIFKRRPSLRGKYLELYEANKMVK